MRQQKSSNKPLLPPARTIPHNARALGEYVLAGKGAGKSRYLGRVKAWPDFIWGTPQVIFDPLGVGTIDNFLDKLCRFLQYVPKSQHRRFWERVRYIDMRGGTDEDAIVPFPLYYRLGSESLREITERYLQAILKMNPGLLQSQVQGYPPLHRIGVYSGLILFALDCQITEAENLLRYPEAWLSRMALAEARFPEIAPAVAFFTNEYLHCARQTARG